MGIGETVVVNVLLSSKAVVKNDEESCKAMFLNEKLG